MATKVGRGVALGLQAIRGFPKETAQISAGRTNGETGKGYSKDDIAALMGFSGVYNRNRLQDIWDIFNKTKGKNIEPYRRHIISCMKQYVYDRRITIDKSIYVGLRMGTISLCVLGLPVCKFLAVPARMRMGTPRTRTGIGFDRCA
jgi:hypothetical protein